MKRELKAFDNAQMHLMRHASHTIPMKRELKGLAPLPEPAPQRHASHTIPMKRELKVTVSAAQRAVTVAASHTIPMKRELKAKHASQTTLAVALHTPSR